MLMVNACLFFKLYLNKIADHDESMEREKADQELSRNKQVLHSDSVTQDIHHKNFPRQALY
jgi:hypothetical protein